MIDAAMHDLIRERADSRRIRDGRGARAGSSRCSTTRCRRRCWARRRWMKCSACRTNERAGACLNSRTSPSGPTGSEIHGTAVGRERGRPGAAAAPAGRVSRAGRPAAAAPIDLAAMRVLERVTRRDVIFFTSQLATSSATGVNLVEGLRDIEDAGRRSRPCKTIIADVRRGVETRHEPLVGPGAAPEGVRRTLRQHRAGGRGDRPRGPGARRPRAAARVAGRPRGRACGRRPRTRCSSSACWPCCSPCSSASPSRGSPRVYASVNANLQLPLPTRVVQAVGTVRRGKLARDPGGPRRALRAVPAARAGAGRARMAGSAGCCGCPSSATCRASWPCRASRTSSARCTSRASKWRRRSSLIERVIGNAYLAQRFRGAVSRVLAGESLSRALGAVGEFSPIVIQMVALGEKTGQMSKALQQVRQYYDREVDRAVSRAIGAIRPRSPSWSWPASSC